MAKKYYYKSGKVITRKDKKAASRERRKERKGLLARRSLPSFKKNTTPTQLFEMRVTERAKRAGKFDPSGTVGSQNIWIRRLNVARKKMSPTFIRGYGSAKTKKRWNK